MPTIRRRTDSGAVRRPVPEPAREAQGRGHPDPRDRGVRRTRPCIIGGDGPGTRGTRPARERARASPTALCSPACCRNERLPEYYAAADVFCMPCTNRYGGLDTEGFGVVYHRGAASGLPCIAGRCGGSAEAVEHGVSVIVLDDPTPRKRRGRAARARKDRALGAKLGGAGRARVETRFAPDVAAGRLEEALETHLKIG